MKRNNPANFTVAIVEPCEMIAHGLKFMIDCLKGFEVVLSVTNDCQYFMEKVSFTHPDILIINPSVIDFKKRNNIKQLNEESKCDIIVALATDRLNPDVLKKYNAVIDITDSSERIEHKMRKIAEAEKSTLESNELTSREEEVLVCIAKGMMNKEIADRYNLSIHTVITHRKNITKKTGIKSISGLTVYAILNNLVNIQEIE